MRQINKLYKKEKSKHKEEKSYVVNRAFKASGKHGKTPRHIKNVDSRMKKDLKRDKMKARKDKRKGGKGGKSSKNKKSKGIKK